MRYSLGSETTNPASGLDAQYFSYPKFYEAILKMLTDEDFSDELPEICSFWNK